jgi:hypothetical protein
VDLIAHVAATSGFFINIIEPPDEVDAVARQLGIRSSFTRCVYAVALGYLYLDLCVGFFSMTDQRLLLSEFVALEYSPIVASAP